MKNSLKNLQKNSAKIRGSMIAVLVVCLCAMGLSCGRAPKSEPDEDSNRFGDDTTSVEYAPVPSAGKFAWKQEWNAHVSNAITTLGPNLVSGPDEPIADAKLLCPNYGEATLAQKKAFWALFFASFARYESGYNPELRFKEPAPLNRYSEGLLQVSYDDEKNHVGCPLNRAKGNILEPDINLACGVAILNNQVAKVGTLFPPRSYYWSVFTNKKQQIINDFVRDSAALKFCR